MDVWTKIKGLRYLGWHTLWRSAVFAAKRDLAELGSRPGREEPVLPGPFVRASVEEDGVRVTFAQADAEIRFEAPGVARVTWQPGALPVPYAMAGPAGPGPAVAVEEGPSGVRLTGPGMTVEIGRDGAVRCSDPEGRTRREDLPPLRCGESWCLRTGLAAGERCFGLGERTAGLDLRGGSFRCYNAEAKGAYGPGQDPLYVCIPVVLGLSAAGASLVFFENAHDGRISLGDPAEAVFESGALRYHVAIGTPEQVLERYSDLTGRPSLPPRWALGFHQARWSYMDEREVREVADGFRSRGLPLSAIHLDIHYMRGHRVFTVDPKRFPDLAGLCRDLAAQRVRVVTILDPGVKQDPEYDVYREGLDCRAFCADADGAPVIAPVWPGDCAFPDFTSPAARDWWGGYYRRLLDAGVAGIWHDMNEPSAFAAWGEPSLPKTARHAMEGRGGTHAEAHNVYALLEARAGHEAMRRERPDRRPWILSRSGHAGIQRYAWTWTGDSETTWWTLHQSIRIALHLGLCGAPYTGPDIGGFGGEPDAELFLRWFQASAFLPFFRTHSAFFTPRREPWCFGEDALAVARKFLDLRYRLLPYLYTVAREASTTGHPLVRPVWWPDGTDPGLLDVDDAFLLGDALLVAPVVQPGVRDREVVLPAGRWHSLWDDRVCDGPGRVRCEAPLDRIPVLVRGGCVLPAEEGGRLVLDVFAPAEGSRSNELYSDAGDGYGPSRIDRFRVSRTREGLEIRWESDGEFAFPWESVAVRVHGFPARRLEVDGLDKPVRDGLADTGRFGLLRAEGEAP
jgi:alpha-glucosidase